MRMRPFSILALMLTAVAAVGVELPGGPKPTAVPPPWQLNDIGVVGVPGTAMFSTGVFRLDGAGPDISDNDDRFAFLSQDAKGDAVFSARIVSQTNTHEWAKGGIMFRDGLEPNTAFAMLAVTPGHGLTFSWRYGPGAGVGLRNLGEEAPFTFPIWLKLEKKNTIFTALRSADGKEWTSLGTVEIPAPFPGLRAGFVVCSHEASKLSTVLFDKVRLDP